MLPRGPRPDQAWPRPMPRCVTSHSRRPTADRASVRTTRCG